MATRMERLLSLWSWLPTFRAAAEQQHVSRAAAQLGVSPSAVSRMIGLLERDVGQPLFNRVGRSIELNEAGAQLLGGVRSAMRLVDESLSAVAGTQLVGEVRIACDEPVTRALVLPALASLRAQHPQLLPVLSSAYQVDVGARLLRGELDVALTWQPLQAEQILLQRLGALPLSVYAGPEHPLASARRATFATMADHPFIVSRLEEPRIGWPRERPRQVAMRTGDIELAAELCAQGQWLAVLPDIVAKRHAEQTGQPLVRLLSEGIRPLDVYALCRVSLDVPGRADAVVTALHEIMSSLT